MQVKSFISSALLLGVVAFYPAINTQEVAAKPSPKKPYCTVASKQGGRYWTWTGSSINQSCTFAMFKVLGFGQSVDRATKGTYKANGLNRAKLRCNQGKKKVIGSGSSVFENGINMAKKLKWNGCTLKITN